jgi:hypothetical protein
MRDRLLADHPEIVELEREVDRSVETAVEGAVESLVEVPA